MCPTPTDNTHVRTKLTKTFDDGVQQKVQADGRSGEKFGGASGQNGTPVHQDYGRSVHRPAGTVMLTSVPDGNPDKAMTMGGEHPDHRPKNLAEGEWKDYDKWGHFLHAKEDRWQIKVGSCTIDIMHDGTVNITANTINLIGDVHLGSTGGVLSAKQGTIDTGGYVDTENLATKVWIT